MTRAPLSVLVASSLVASWLGVASLEGCTSDNGRPPTSGGKLQNFTDPPDSSPVPVPDASQRDGADDAGALPATDGGDDAGDDGPIAIAADASVGTPPQCATGHTWATAGALASEAIDRFGGVAPTGLTAAWTRTSGGAVAADRAGTSSPYTTLSILLPVLLPGTRAAIDSTGTLVLAVGFNGLNAQVWQRPDTQAPWQVWAAPTTPFDAIAHAVGKANATWSEPAFGASGDRLYYLVTPPAGGADDGGSSGAVPVMIESQWDPQAGAWTAGVPLANAELTSADASHRRRPTGASADDRTLFFFDEVTGIERAAWRDDATAPFDHFEDIPVAAEAAPNLDCQVLYYLGAGADGATGLFTAQ